MAKNILLLLFSFQCFIVACSVTPRSSDLIFEGGAVAVWDLEDMSPMLSPIPGLGEILSGEVINAVESLEKYTVVEREKLVLALEELNIGTSVIVDEDTRLRLGKLVGARWMIFGGYQVIGNIMRLDMRKVHVETGQVVKTAEKEVNATDISAWLPVVRNATHELF
jgi:hypothetical protein